MIRSYIRSILEYGANYIPAIITCIVLLLVGQVISPGFASMNNIGNIFTISSLLVIVGIGQFTVLLAGNCGIDLSVGSVVSMGAMIGALVTAGSASRVPFAVLVIVLLGGVIGLINGMGVQLLKIPALAMTLIISYVVDGCTLYFTRGKTVARLPKLLSQIARPIFGIIRPIMLVAVVLIILSSILLSKTVFGRKLYLTGCNRSAGILNGIRTDIIGIEAYVICGMFAAFAGIVLAGYTGAAKLQMGSSYTMMSVAAVVIGGTNVSGGRGTIFGVVLGSVDLVLINNILVAAGFSAGLRQFLQGVILLLIMLMNCRDKKLRQ